MKQTAVEWLLEQMNNIKGSSISMNGRVQFIEKQLNNLLDQAKAMEKEQMVAFAEFVATYPDKNININGEMLHAKSKYDGAERTIDLLEIFIVP